MSTYLISTIFLIVSLCAAGAVEQRVLFIRGGNGTVGFLEGGSDEQGADVFNYLTFNGNHGWGELNAALSAEGFVIEQLAENPVVGDVPTPVPLDTINLSQYSVIVFGSNNAEYTESQVGALMNYIQTGGSALFISDANFGQNWGDAPSSDQHFLNQFGLTMNQDTGTYSIRRDNEFVVPTHPIFEGVDQFDGEGVSPITLGTAPNGVTSSLLTLARNNVRRNTGVNQGPTEAVTANDGSLIIATYGTGRIACHFDRNTFFNDNGAGTNINRLDNEAYARNLFNWLAGNSIETANYAPRGHFPNLAVGSQQFEGVGFSADVIAKDLDGNVASVVLKVGETIIATDNTAPYEFAVSGLNAGNHILTATVMDNLGISTDVDLPIEVIGSGDIEIPLDRDGWVLSANRNSEDLGNAIDGDTGTRWATEQVQQSGQKFGVDFGQREQFQKIMLDTSSSPNDYPRGYIIRGSDDGQNFVTLATGVGVAGGDPTNILFSPPVTYRYLEIEQTGSSSTNWWSIHEINVFHPPANAVLPLGSWLQFHFGDSAPDLLTDQDGDGITLLEEYAFFLNPFENSRRGVPSGTSGVDPADQSRYIDLTYRRLNDDSESSVDLVIEAASDLNMWSSTGLNIEFPENPIPNGDSTETVTARIKFSSDQTRNFVRLRTTVK